MKLPKGLAKDLKETINLELWGGDSYGYISFNWKRSWNCWWRLDRWYGTVKVAGKAVGSKWKGTGEWLGDVSLMTRVLSFSNRRPPLQARGVSE